MNQSAVIDGFSKLSASERVKLLREFNYLDDADIELIKQLNSNTLQHNIVHDISENVTGAFSLPFSIAPNFLLNNRFYAIPMVIEESSVVAAASKSAKFWAANGGFKAKTISTEKVGHIYFRWSEEIDLLNSGLEQIKDDILKITHPLTKNMHMRGGGIVRVSFELVENIANSYKLSLFFETADSMGANFINTCLEETAQNLTHIFNKYFPEYDPPVIVMSILSNYTPDCIVECAIETNCDVLNNHFRQIDFTQKFKLAVDIANNDIYRAVTHNKGIFNGMDAVILATGNDFRATEACGHAYASKSGMYRSLSNVEITDKKFRYTLRVPFAIGTVGGLTKLHPMASLALKILRYPSAEELMQIIAAAGMANNFSAIASLITEGIQRGHMKMHLSNILKSMGASEEEQKEAKEYFSSRPVSVVAVNAFLQTLRN